MMLCVAAAVLLSACHSGRNVTRTPEGHSASWQLLEVPVKLSMSKPMSMSMSGKLIVKRDSAAYLSLRMLGMEVAYAYADADSAVLCDRYHKLYLAEPLEKLLPRGHNKVSDLQRLLMGGDKRSEVAKQLIYGQMSQTPYGDVPSSIGYEGKIGRQQIDVELQLNYEKTKYDDPGTRMPVLKLPKNAQRVSPQSILESL